MPTPHTIIVAEPDPIFGSVLRVEFTRGGFTVLMAGDAPEAEDFARRTEARLVLLDSSLPGVSSFDASARIRRQPTYDRTPIVLTVRDAAQRIDRAASIAGFTLVLVKPYAFSDLLDAIEPHVPPDDPLLTTRATLTGLAAPSARPWGPTPPLTWKSAPDSGLTQNARVLPIVRGSGKRIPLVRKP
jgi:two-component system chemotaxis response regulator CheY